MTAAAQRAQALSSAAAVLSAFLVFVIGGGVLLGVWAQQRELAETAAEQVLVAAEQERAAEQARKEKAAAEVEKVQRKTPRRTTRTRTRTPAKAADAAKSKGATSGAETVQAAKVAKAVPAAKDLTGRGSVLVYGDATRVRLMGSKGTFGAGKVPAGRYTVQATFVGFEPRMAGTVEVSNGARLSLVCASSTKTCEAR
jgi:hypothetical protein